MERPKPFRADDHQGLAIVDVGVGTDREHLRDQVSRSVMVTHGHPPRVTITSQYVVSAIPRTRSRKKWDSPRGNNRPA